MKKKKSRKNKIRNMVRISVILFLSLIISIIFCRREISANDKILQSTVNDAFVFQSILLANSLEPNKPSDYIDIENLEDDSESFVSDVAIKTGSSQYYIRVNYGANCVTVYKKGSDGTYSKPYKAMVCSTGKATPTSGTYKVSYKYRWLRLYGGVYGQYSTRIVKSILFHSVPYLDQRADTLEWEEFDKLGTTASAGCIRLTVQDAKWIYDNITSGTYVEFYSDKSNPGPLGKPTAQKISSNKKCRNWDPTDPDINNPWNGGSGIPSVIYTTPSPSTQNTSNTSNNQNNDNINDNDDDQSSNNNNTSTSVEVTNTHPGNTHDSGDDNDSNHDTNPKDPSEDDDSEQSQKPSETTTNNDNDPSSNNNQQETPKEPEDTKPSTPDTPPAESSDSEESQTTTNNQ